MLLAVHSLPFAAGATVQLVAGGADDQRARAGNAPPAAIDTAVVGSDGSVSFDGLEADTAYWLVGQDPQGEWRWIRGRTDESQTARYTVEDPEDLPFLIDVEAGQVEDVFVIRKDGADLVTIDNDGVLNLTGGAAEGVPFVLKTALALDIDDYATGDGSDETVVVQAAFDAAMSQRRPLRIRPGKTYMVSSLTITSSITVQGDLTGRIKQIAGTDDHLIKCTTNNLRIRLERAIFDGNCTAQTDDSTHEFSTIYVSADSTSATAPFRLEVEDCTFVNGRQFDIQVHKATNESTSSRMYVTVNGSRFFGGKQADALGFGTSYIEIVGAPSVEVTNNIFDFEGVPTIGRAGVLISAGDTLKGRMVVTDNEFRNVGTTLVSGTLGAIDMYSGSDDSVVMGNQVISPLGRGIAIKSDSGNDVIANNTVDGLSGATKDAQITCNRAVHGTPTGNMTIAGNTLLNSGNDGISLSGTDLASSGAHAAHFTVSDNTIVGAARRAIGLIGVGASNVDSNTIDCPAGAEGVFVSGAVESVSVSDNTIEIGAGNAIEFDTTNALCMFTINDNTIPNPSGRGIYVGSGLGGEIEGNNLRDCGNAAITVLNTTQPVLVTANRARGTNSTFFNGGTNSKLWVARNYFENGITGSGSKLTLDVSGNAVAWCEHHQIETLASAAAQDMNALTGVPDGEVVTISPWNSTHVVTVKDGAGIKLTADFVMNTASATLTLRQLETELRQLSAALN